MTRAIQEINDQIDFIDQQLVQVITAMAGLQQDKSQLGLIPGVQLATLAHQAKQLHNRLKRVSHLFRHTPHRTAKVYSVLFWFNHRLRLIKKSYASLYCSVSWHSPPHNSRTRLVGLRKNRLMLQMHDYERMYYQTYDKLMYFDALYLPIPETFRVSFLRNSGMAAFSNIYATIIARHLQQPDRYFLYGQRCYFEIRDFFNNHVQPVQAVGFDERKASRALIRALSDPNCIGMLVDTALNHPGGHMPDLVRIIEALAKSKRHAPFVLVVDATLTALSFQPANYFKTLPFPPFLQLMVFRSLIKFDQLGEDKVMAGVITQFVERNAHETGEYPMYNVQEFNFIQGTQLPEHSLESLDFPTPERLALRTERHEQNALRLATRLIELQKQFPGIIRQVSSTALNAEGKARAGVATTGGLIFVALYAHPRIRMDELKKHWTSEIYTCAKRERLIIQEGQSFGFDYTRICTFLLRIAPGTEDCANFERVIACFEAGFQAFRKRYYTHIQGSDLDGLLLKETR